MCCQIWFQLQWKFKSLLVLSKTVHPIFTLCTHSLFQICQIEHPSSQVTFEKTGQHERPVPCSGNLLLLCWNLSLYFKQGRYQAAVAKSREAFHMKKIPLREVCRLISPKMLDKIICSSFRFIKQTVAFLNPKGYKDKFNLLWPSQFP